MSEIWQRETLEQKHKQSLLADFSLSNEALEAFIQAGFPTRKMEEWKYTSVSEIIEGDYDLSAALDTSATVVLPELDAYQIVILDGRLQSEYTNIPNEISIVPITEKLSDLKINEKQRNVFTDLNLALVDEGLAIIVPNNFVLDKPIHISYQQNHKTIFNFRTLVIAEPASQLTLFEEFSGNNKYFTNVVTQLIAQQAAVIQHIKFQRESLHAQHIANTIVKQARDSSVTSVVISKGASLARENLSFDLQEQGASAHLYGLYTPSKGQHIDHHTRIDHSVPNCFSQQVYKGIIDEKGSGVFNGKVIVHPDAQQTAAYQNNQNLLLSDNAEINTKPELEIYADDVKCAHGATVGQLDENALFYLRSRGVPMSDAKTMLVAAFADEIIESIPHEALKEYIRGFNDE